MTPFGVEGDSVGDAEGVQDGVEDGTIEGSEEGCDEGSKEGSEEGFEEGIEEGLKEGSEEGSADADSEGCILGLEDGSNEGTDVGADVKVLAAAVLDTVIAIDVEDWSCSGISSEQVPIHSQLLHAMHCALHSPVHDEHAELRDDIISWVSSTDVSSEETLEALSSTVGEGSLLLLI